MINKMAEYDKIAEEYSEVQDKRISRTYLYDINLFNQIGDLKGKSILDLACGDGRLTREIKKRGADKVLGIDISEEMIKIALKKEAEDKLNIDYKVGAVGELGKLGKFDIIVAGFLLHYSKTKEELQKMCNDIALNLKKDGRFVALNTNPEFPLTTNKKYETTVKSKGPLKEGSELIVTLYQKDEEICSFNTYNWNKETYEKCMKNAGLNVKWIPLKITDKALKEFGKEFWDDYFKNPIITIIEAKY